MEDQLEKLLHKLQLANVIPTNISHVQRFRVNIPDNTHGCQPLNILHSTDALNFNQVSSDSENYELHQSSQTPERFSSGGNILPKPWTQTVCNEVLSELKSVVHDMQTDIPAVSSNLSVCSKCSSCLSTASPTLAPRPSPCSSVYSNSCPRKCTPIPRRVHFAQPFAGNRQPSNIDCKLNMLTNLMYQTLCKLDKLQEKRPMKRRVKSSAKLQPVNKVYILKAQPVSASAATAATSAAPGAAASATRGAAASVAPVASGAIPTTSPRAGATNRRPRNPPTEKSKKRTKSSKNKVDCRDCGTTMWCPNCRDCSGVKSTESMPLNSNRQPSSMPTEDKKKLNKGTDSMTSSEESTVSIEAKEKNKKEKSKLDKTSGSRPENPRGSNMKERPKENKQSGKMDKTSASMPETPSGSDISIENKMNGRSKENKKPSSNASDARVPTSTTRSTSKEQLLERNVFVMSNSTENIASTDKMKSKSKEKKKSSRAMSPASKYQASCNCICSSCKHNLNTKLREMKTFGRVGSKEASAISSEIKLKPNSIETVRYSKVTEAIYQSDGSRERITNMRPARKCCCHQKGATTALQSKSRRHNAGETATINQQLSDDRFRYYGRQFNAPLSELDEISVCHKLQQTEHGCKPMGSQAVKFVVMKDKSVCTSSPQNTAFKTVRFIKLNNKTIDHEHAILVPTAAFATRTTQTSQPMLPKFHVPKILSWSKPLSDCAKGTRAHVTAAQEAKFQCLLEEEYRQRLAKRFDRMP